MSNKSVSKPGAMPIEVAREIARQGDARLTALTALATAADLRATTFSGILGAASIGAGAAVLTVLVSEHKSMPLIVGGTILALGLFVGAISAAWAGAPRDFYVGGGNPDALRAWAWDGYHWREEAELLDSSGVRYSEAIKFNRTLLRSNSRRMSASLWIAFATPFAAVGAFFAERSAMLPF